MTPALAALALAAHLALAGPPPPAPPDPCAPPDSAALSAHAAHLARFAAAGGTAPQEPGDDSLHRALDGYVRQVAQGSRDRRWDMVAVAQLQSAAIWNRLGLPARAEAPAASAVALLDRVAQMRGADPQIVPAAHMVLGETLQHRGRTRDALAHYDSALAAVAPAHVALRGQLCNDRGIALLSLGAIDAAARHLDRALAIRRAAGDRDGEAVVLNNRARLLQTIGAADASLALIDSALTLRVGAPSASGSALLHNNAGYAHDLRRRPREALLAYTRALDALGGRHPSLAGLTLLNRGRAHLALGDPAAAERDLLAARALKRTAGDSLAEAWVLHDLGRVHLARREWAPARARLDSARALLHALEDPLREGSARFYLGVAHESDGTADGRRRAVAEYAAAAALRRTLARTSARDEDRVMLAEQDVALTARWALAWVGLQEGAVSATAALTAAEQGRARALLDLLPTGEQDASAVRPDSLDADAPLRAVRRERTPALSYLVTDSALVVWLALPDGRLRMDCQRVSRDVLHALIRQYRRYLQAPDATQEPSRRAMLLDAAAPAPAAGCRTVPPPAADPGSLEATGAALARLLLPAPLADALPIAGELIVVPHGALALVPFAALPLRDGEPLGLRLALRHAPSLALLAAGEPSGAAGAPALRSRLLGRSALVVGDPTMPPAPDGARLAPLPTAGRTAAWLAAMLQADTLTGSSATPQAVLARLGAARLVHLGTHGRAYAGARARESFVALAAAGDTVPGAGLLRVQHLLEAGPLQAELVALTACETGLGEISEAEGTIGFQRALLGRGARSALLSLWRVRETETDLLVRRFYHHWLDAGASKPEALRLAQRELHAELSRLAAERRQPDLANPYLWAGFQLVGAR